MNLIKIAVIITALSSVALSAEELVDAVLAEVNGKVVTRSDITELTREPLAKLSEKYKGQIPREELQALLADALRAKVERILLLDEAENAVDERVKEKIDQDVEAQIKDLVAETGSLVTFQRELEKKGETLDSTKRKLREDILIQELINEKVRIWVTVSPGELRDYYHEHKNDFEHREAASFRQIMIKVGEYEDRAHARKAAESVLERINEGQDFAQLAEQRSQGPASAKGGLWDYIERGNLLKEIEDAAFALKPGEVSPIIETEKAFFILKCEGARRGRTDSFEEVQDKIRQIIVEKKFQENLVQYLTKLKNKAQVTLYATPQ